MVVKHIAVILIGLCVAGISCCADKDRLLVTNSHSKVDWLTDFKTARKIAAEKKLPILADFSGSDWCGWCIRLDKEVFSQQAFQDYAKDHLVLFVADFPKRKDQPADVRRQNEALARTYSISGFPTVLLLRPDGKVIARTGYRSGGASAYVAHIRNLLKQKGVLDDER